MNKNVSKEEASVHLVSWYREYVAPVFDKLVQEKGYAYNAMNEFDEFEKEWSLRGEGVSAYGLQSTLKKVINYLRDCKHYESWKDSIEKWRDCQYDQVYAKKVHCFIWDGVQIRWVYSNKICYLLFPPRKRFAKRFAGV